MEEIERLMIKGKSSQGFSLNTIIIAAVVLIVLVVIWSIFTGRMGGFVEEVNECRSPIHGLQGEGECPDGTAGYPGTRFEKCCIELTKVEPVHEIQQGW